MGASISEIFRATPDPSFTCKYRIGLWPVGDRVLIGLAIIQQSLSRAFGYAGGLDFTEAAFVVVIMLIAATRPVLELAETSLVFASKALPLPEGVSFYCVALILGPLLGSFITEPAAMTLLAILLKRHYFDREISTKFAYATLGLLFVNISIGGSLTNFAAPPILMVAHTWNWNLLFVFVHFGWRAICAVTISTAIIATMLRAELAKFPLKHAARKKSSFVVLPNLLFLSAIVYFGHSPWIFLGIFAGFLGWFWFTRRKQGKLRLGESIGVGIFLAGLIVLGSMQGYWLASLVSKLRNGTMFFGATALTAFTDNAALTYLGSLITDIGDDAKYALVAGAIAGGGLTMIANAPNPAGAGILQDARVFKGAGISPLGLLLGALLPTAVTIGMFWFLR